MIDKNQAKDNHLNTIETRDRATNDHSVLLDKLKALIPSIVNSDNVLDMNALSDLIDMSETTANNHGYELTFAGKGLAKAKAEIPTEKDLKLEHTQSKNFDDTDNVVIRGDNLDVLKILKQNYTNKIKMIYIDPPYNTKNENFVYNDNFKVNDATLVEEFSLDSDTVNYLSNVYGTRSHSGWLSFMYPRLKLARELLREDGVIFISIDDNEQANLKILCDELFGEDNFVGMISVENNPKGRKNSKYISITNEFCFIYAKSFNSSYFIPNISKEAKELSKDEHGRYVHKSGKRVLVGENDFNELVEDMSSEKHYSVYYNKKDNNIEIKTEYEIHDIDKNLIENGYVRYISYNSGEFVENTYSKEKFKVLFNEDSLEFTDCKIFEKNYNTTIRMKSILKNLNYTGIKNNQESKIKLDYKTTSAGTYLKKLFDGKEVFIAPKSIDLLKTFLTLFDDTSYTVLDFFAGSGTTGDAVMQLNAEDGGNRKYILAQWDEEIKLHKKSKIAYKFCSDNDLTPVISSITIERLNRAGEKILSEKPILKNSLDIGYRVFSLQDKRKLDTDNETLIVKNAEHYTTLDKLYSLIGASSQPLNSKVETIEENLLYKINNAYYVLGNFTTSLEDLKDHQIYIDGYSSITLEHALNLDILDNSNVSVVY